MAPFARRMADDAASSAMITDRREISRKRCSGLLPALAAAVLVVTFAHPAPAQTTTSQRCVKDDDIRLIEISFADPADSPPCKVIYRPEADSDTLGIVSWQDLDSHAACEAQADLVVGRLAEEGWDCLWEELAEGTATRTVLARSASESLEPSGAEESDAPPPSDPPGDLALLTPEAAEPIDEPAKLVENPDIAPPPDDLASLVQRDLRQLDTTLDGLLEGKIAGYGDLNGDDIDDALVLYTYSSPQPAYRQFLAVYVSSGDSFQLTATKPVGGHVSGTMDARLETIDRGVIHLNLRAFEPGDRSCCPSGDRHLALTLRDLDLVEIDAEAPTRY